MAGKMSFIPGVDSVATVSVKDPDKKPLKERLIEQAAKKLSVSGPDIVDRANVLFKPSPIQMKYAKLLLTDTELKNKRQLANSLNIKQTMIDSWYRNPGFRLWLEDMRHLLFDQFKLYVDRRLIEKCMEGSEKHMKLFYALSGDLQMTLLERTRTSENEAGMDVSRQYEVFQERMAIITGKVGRKNQKEITDGNIRVVEDNGESDGGSVEEAPAQGAGVYPDEPPVLREEEED